MSITVKNISFVFCQYGQKTLKWI